MAAYNRLLYARLFAMPRAQSQSEAMEAMRFPALISSSKADDEKEPKFRKFAKPLMVTLYYADTSWQENDVPCQLTLQIFGDNKQQPISLLLEPKGRGIYGITFQYSHSVVVYPVVPKWEHMQHCPTITNLRKGIHAVTLIYDDGYIHEHTMVALAQYGWGKAAMIQDEHNPTTYRLSFMVDPIENCQHNNKSVSYCIHFKFIIDDQWTLSREYFKVSECNGQVINNYLCLKPSPESIYIAKWEHMQHRPTITDLRKGTHPVTLTYDDGYVHEHIMVALAQYGWGKAAMIQDEHNPTTYKLSFMVDPIKYHHDGKDISYCIHFKFIIDDQWTLSRKYFKVSECNGQVINNYLCLKPSPESLYVTKWEHMQHRPTITDLRKGTHPVTLTYDDGYIHEHIMVALAQYGWGKAAMIQDEHNPTTYRLSFMVDPIENCQHNNKSVSYCIHFKFIIDDQWTLSREYFKVSECNGQVINNYLCLMPTDESCLRPRSGYVW